MSFPFHPQVPQPNDDPTQSQGDLLDNFQSMNAQWNLNHNNLTATSNQGFHTQVWFPKGLPFTSDPNLTSPAASLYPKVAADGTTELFFQNGDDNGFVEQLTNLPIFNMQIESITNAAAGIVTVTNPNGHGLLTGDTITINGAYGMTINGVSATITKLSSTTFSIGNTVGLGTYIGNSGYYVITSSPVSNVNTVWGMFTPWGITFNFGSAGANATVNFAATYNPGFKHLYAAVTPTTGIPNFAVTDFRAISMTYISSSALNYFLAIGK